jgi:hypothetical protein
MTLYDEVLQNGDSSTSPQPIRAHGPKANEGMSHQLHVPVLASFVFLFSQGLEFEDCDVFARKRFENIVSTTIPRPITIHHTKATDGTDH